MNGIYVGNSIQALRNYEDPDPAKPTYFFGRKVDSIFLFTSHASWDKWEGTLTYLKTGSMFGGFDRPLVWSIPLFPVPLQATDDSFAAAISSVPEARRQAETAVLSGSAFVLSDTTASVPVVDNVVGLSSQWGAIQFSMLDATSQVRLHYMATEPGRMKILVNGIPHSTIDYPATSDPDIAADKPQKYIYRDLFIDVAIPQNGSIKFQNDGGHVWTTDYLAWGNYNQHYRDAATVLRDSRPGDAVIFIRPGWEFNGDWYPWSAKGGRAESYKETFRKLVTEFRAVSSRFRFDWCPNFGTGFVDPELCYPGDAFVDIIGVDLYDSEKNTGIDDRDARWEHCLNPGGSKPRGLEWIRRFAGERNKLIAISEWGVGDHNVPDNATETKIDDNPVFVSRMQQWIAANEVVYHHYWESADSYDGRLADFVPFATANQYLFSFATPLMLQDGSIAPPANCSDEFNKSTPRPFWRFVRPEPTGWSLDARPGMLRIASTSSDLVQGAVPAKNIVLQTAPDKDFDVVTRVYGRPALGNQQCGLIVYWDDDNYLKMVRKYEGGNRFVFANETAGSLASGSVADGIPGSLAYLKISRTGNSYRGYYSANGGTWTQVWTAQTRGLATPRIGLMSFGTPGLIADFDTFHVSKVEAEYGAMAGSASTGTNENTERSGSKAVGWLDNPGAAVEWINVPGGARLVVRYASPYGGHQSLYVDGVWVRSVEFGSTGSNTTYHDLIVDTPNPAGSTLRLQHDAGGTAWNIDCINFIYESRFEAEEGLLTGSTARDPNPAASQECAIRVGGSGWGGVQFNNVNLGTQVRIRYLAQAGGTMTILVNGAFQRHVPFTATPSPLQPGGFVFRDLVVNLNTTAGGSVKLQNDSGSTWLTDYIVVQ